MNRSQRRRAQHQAKVQKKDKNARQLSQRARFEQDLRRALECEDMKLVSMAPSQEQHADTGAPTGETFWVLTVYAEGRFVHIKSSRGTIADIASGVVRAAREAIAKQDSPDKTTAPAPTVSLAEADAAIRAATPPAPLSLGERIERGLV